jgi:hypothetical protein
VWGSIHSFIPATCKVPAHRKQMPFVEFRIDRRPLGETPLWAALGGIIGCDEALNRYVAVSPHMRRKHSPGAPAGGSASYQ